MRKSKPCARWSFSFEQLNAPIILITSRTGGPLKSSAVITFSSNPREVQRNTERSWQIRHSRAPDENKAARAQWIHNQVLRAWGVEEAVTLTQWALKCTIQFPAYIVLYVPPPQPGLTSSPSHQLVLVIFTWLLLPSAEQRADVWLITSWNVYCGWAVVT